MSGDSVEQLRKFRDKYKLNFPLAGDLSHKALEAYGVWQEKKLYGKVSRGIVRATFLIDVEGKIQHIFPKVKVDGHIQEVLSALRS